jgi:hypothetical protein
MKLAKSLSARLRELFPRNGDGLFNAFYGLRQRGNHFLVFFSEVLLPVFNMQPWNLFLLAPWEWYFG